MTAAAAAAAATITTVVPMKKEGKTHIKHPTKHQERVKKEKMY
jgi:hypothetical protein